MLEEIIYDIEKQKWRVIAKNTISQDFETEAEAIAFANGAEALTMRVRQYIFLHAPSNRNSKFLLKNSDLWEL